MFNILTKQANKDPEITVEIANNAYASLVIAMRKDIGFNKTRLKSEDYRFLS